MINFLQVPPVEPQPGFMQQYSFIIMIGLMVLVLWLFMWRPESKRRKEMQKFREGLKKFAAFLFAGSNILFYICIPVRKTRAQSQQHCRGGGNF